LGYFDLDERDDLAGKTFAQVTAGLMGKGDTSNLKTDLAAHLNISLASGVMMTLEWLGLLSDAPVSDTNTVLDVLADQLLVKMPYGEGERDILIMAHKFVAVYPDRQEQISSTLIDYGIPGGDSSMARTVGLPAAIGIRMILDGKITLTGVQIPVLPEIYNPVLDELERLGIAFEEKTVVKRDA
jgi:saccharopine dehydrogenase-like NADP-dependent oxidoreductase